MKLSKDEQISRCVFEKTKKSWVLRHAGVFFADDLIWLLVGIVLGVIVFGEQFVISGADRWMFVVFTTALFFSWFLTAIVARVVRRRRPYDSQDYNPIIKPFIETSSFPSSHATFSFAMFGFVLAASIHELFWLFFVGVLLVSFGRVMVGVHRFSEIVVGAAIGLTAGYCFTRLFIWFLPML